MTCRATEQKHRERKGYFQLQKNVTKGLLLFFPHINTELDWKRVKRDRFGDICDWVEKLYVNICNDFVTDAALALVLSCRFFLSD